jgi:hypothetical protein
VPQHTREVAADSCAATHVKELHITLAYFRDQITSKKKTKTKLHGLSLQANYTYRANTARRRSDCQLVRIEGATWSA